MNSQDESNVSYLRPRFRLDMCKYIYLLRKEGHSQREADVKNKDVLPLSAENTSKGLKSYGRFEGIGNLHFHNETLRHNHGEFTLNRIYKTPSNGTQRIHKKLKIKTKNSVLIQI